MKHTLTEIAIGLFCLAMLLTTGCVQRTYSNQSQGENYDIRVTSNSFFADSAGQNLDGVFYDGAGFGAGIIESEINALAIEAVADAMKSPLFELLRGGL